MLLHVKQREDKGGGVRGEVISVRLIGLPSGDRYLIASPLYGRE